MIRKFLADPQAWAQEAILRAQSERRRIHGIDVWLINDRQFATSDELFAKIAASLQLVADHAPWRLKAMRRDFARIFMHRQDGVRAMFDLMRNCSLDTYFVATFAAEQVASSIVHEAVHARLRNGRTIPRDLIAWEERLCRKAELAFGLRIPDGTAVVERARAALALSDHDVAPLAGDIQLRQRRPRGNGGLA
ncbi:hypothetical protein [Longimicrobium sp.]|uniref:hypothetical protein n=1 Tax=Longimicrobium sp. TaxID=2029185 RepID=UPI003B3A5199